MNSGSGTGASVEAPADTSAGAVTSIGVLPSEFSAAISATAATGSLTISVGSVTASAISVGAAATSLSAGTGAASIDGASVDLVVAGFERLRRRVHRR